MSVDQAEGFVWRAFGWWVKFSLSHPCTQEHVFLPRYWRWFEDCKQRQPEVPVEPSQLFRARAAGLDGVRHREDQGGRFKTWWLMFAGAEGKDYRGSFGDFSWRAEWTNPTYQNRELGATQGLSGAEAWISQEKKLEWIYLGNRLNCLKEYSSSRKHEFGS